jgi:hypothetical protein
MRKKNISERIQDELKYSEEINKKINSLEKKVKIKKENSRVNKINFEFTKEMNYLKEQQ